MGREASVKKVRSCKVCTVKGEMTAKELAQHAATHKGVTSTARGWRRTR
jgi:hypothetical protein